MYTPGTVLLWIATLLGIFSATAFGRAIRDEHRWLQRGRQAFVLMTVALLLASALLMYLIVSHDYRVAYVWSYSDSSLPLPYLISTFWAGQEGSFLLWVLCGAMMGLPLMSFARHYESRVMLFYNLTLLSLLLLLLRQSPFAFHAGLEPGMIPADGNGLNPLLQNPWMVIHPPAMFIGYASLAIPFAFALTALWLRRYEEWIRVSLPWVLLSLFTLGAAIMMGGYWAYETLGWGGYWGWDPVENASLVPWLLTAALAHGMLLQRSSGRFRRLNLVLAVLAFLLVVYATFLTRSGVLSDFSVHSFVDLGITSWLVFNMTFFLLLSLGMLVWRWREIPVEIGTEPFLSRTIFTVLGLLMLLLIGMIVGLGTSSPLLTRVVGEPQQVGPGFYNRVGAPLAICLALILAVVPSLRWKGAKERAGRRLLLAAAPVVVILVIARALGLEVPGTVDLRFLIDVVARKLGLELAESIHLTVPIGYPYLAVVLLALLTNGLLAIDKLRDGRWRRSGAALAHVGIALMLLGFATTGWLDRQEKVQLRQGQPQEVLGYQLTLAERVLDHRGRSAMQVQVTTGSGDTSLLEPLMWINPKSNQMVANPDIRSYLLTDLYLAPAEYRAAEEPRTGSASGLVVKKGEPASFGDWSVLFHGFEMQQHGTSTDTIAVAVLLELRRGDEVPIELRPLFVSRGGGEVGGEPLEVDGVAGASVRVLRIDADNGLVQLELVGLADDGAEPVTDGGGGIPATLVLDVSTKPLILLVWLGTLIALAGNVLAVARRWKDVGSIREQAKNEQPGADDQQVG